MNGSRRNKYLRYALSNITYNNTQYFCGYQSLAEMFKIQLSDVVGLIRCSQSGKSRQERQGQEPATNNTRCDTATSKINIICFQR